MNAPQPQPSAGVVLFVTVLFGTVVGVAAYWLLTLPVGGM